MYIFTHIIVFHYYFMFDEKTEIPIRTNVNFFKSMASCGRRSVLVTTTVHNARLCRVVKQKFAILKSFAAFAAILLFMFFGNLINKMLSMFSKFTCFISDQIQWVESY